ncbi:hypothetical protein L1D14_07595 [Vibrio tubiashii]|uniref:hypothetical protein n=1 Tax=Vibrio tubiashii TaxID=29498 RepID=UPI001EFCB2D9|nr:hypothetical protein [Vibrio tubiashii]MCG9576102.1 hypothetical protein [Vibrio tubiashii]
MASKWVSIKYKNGLLDCGKEPPLEVPVKCKLQHWFTNNIQEHEMIRVEASDHNWVSADDRSELDYNWNVIEWLETPEIAAKSA